MAPRAATSLDQLKANRGAQTQAIARNACYTTGANSSSSNTTRRS